MENLAVWFEIPVTDMERAKKFYSEVCLLEQSFVKEPDKSIATSKKLLITAIARARNTGMEFNDAGNSLLDRGKPPILMEPVKATITILKPGTPKLVLLDHDGLRTAATLPIENSTFTIDGARDKTPYYLVEF